MPEIRYLSEEQNLIPQVVKLFEEELATIDYYNELALSTELEHYSEENLLQKVNEDDKSVIIALENNEVMGICFNRFDDYTIWLEWIITSKNHLRKGLGKLLIDKLVESAKERGCHKIWCDCRTTNDISKAFLKRNGFELITEIKNHWYNQDFVLLQKYPLD